MMQGGRRGEKGGGRGERGAKVASVSKPCAMHWVRATDCFP